MTPTPARTAAYKPSIIQYPTGNWGFVGSLPEALTVTVTNKAGQLVQVSRVVYTKEQAEQLLAHATPSTTERG